MPSLDHLKDTIIKNNTINPALYDEYDVKRGLRNKNGSGVLAGLSQVSSVIGSQIVDGDLIPIDGELKLRGIQLADLVDQVSQDRYAFERVVYLLLVGQLPSDDEFQAMMAVLDEQRTLPSDVLEHAIKGFSSDNIMNKLQTAVSSLYSYDSDPDSVDPYDNVVKALGLIAKFPAIVAYSYLQAYKDNPTFVDPKPGMSIAESLLYMLREGQEPSAVEAQVLDVCLVLHAEHGGGNNSSFTTYVVSSSHSDIYSTMAAAIASLKGPLHGAASIKARLMVDDIIQHISSLTDKEELSAYVLKILKKEAFDQSGKIYGLGHAVYTKSDPRAEVLKSFAKKLAEEKGKQDELQLYLNLEELGPQLFNEFKGSKKVISPNVDFFSGFVYTCLGIPSEIFTPLFATARVSGWCAHRIEEFLSGKRIIRPAYKFVG